MRSPNKVAMVLQHASASNWFIFASIAPETDMVARGCLGGLVFLHHVLHGDSKRDEMDERKLGKL